jgi:hypothetical protein
MENFKHVPNFMKKKTVKHGHSKIVSKLQICKPTLVWEKPSKLVLQVLRFSQQWLLRLWSSRLWHHVVFLGTYQCFRETLCIHLQGLSEAGGRMFLLNASICPQNYMVLQSRGQQSWTYTMVCFQVMIFTLYIHNLYPTFLISFCMNIMSVEANLHS